MKRAKIRAVSKKQSGKLADYHKARKIFLAANPHCAVHAHFFPDNPKVLAHDIHHKRGRVGPLLMDETHWLPVNRVWHRWIHENPAKARELGFLG